MISIEQIRAARALLDLNQQELAKLAGISMRTLNTLERAVVAPRTETLRAIQAVLEARGIEFLPDHGIKLRSERLDVIKIEGPHSVEKFLEDITDQLKEKGGEVLFNGIDERKFSNIDSSIMDNYFRRCHKAGITERLLMREGDYFFAGHPSFYRWASSSIFAKVLHIVYGDSTSFLFWEPAPKLVIMRNPSVAATFRDQFNITWKSATVPPGISKLKAPDTRQPWSMKRGGQMRAELEKILKRKIV
ncbi:MAG: helix-turn-helix transcriptional regulator [Alphaproteobacteria bacterium]|nr:helix-turn-helix transcriptional regulator [Alphaproteobacteria bacterium]